jgi:hypothetical protein
MMRTHSPGPRRPAEGAAGEGGAGDRERGLAVGGEVGARSA